MTDKPEKKTVSYDSPCGVKVTVTEGDPAVCPVLHIPLNKAALNGSHQGQHSPDAEARMQKQAYESLPD